MRRGPGLINALLIALLVFVRVGPIALRDYLGQSQGPSQLATMNDRSGVDGGPSFIVPKLAAVGWIADFRAYDKVAPIAVTRRAGVEPLSSIQTWK